MGAFGAGYVHMLSRRSRPPIDELEEALWLNPNFALGYMVVGGAHGFAGAGDEGLRHLAKAMRLSPRDPHQSLYQSACALCHFVAGRYRESVVLNRRAVQLRPRFTSAWRTLAAAAGMAGDTEPLQVHSSKPNGFSPSSPSIGLRRHYPLVRPEDRAIYIEGLRKPASDEAKPSIAAQSELAALVKRVPPPSLSTLLGAFLSARPT